MRAQIVRQPIRLLVQRAVAQTLALAKEGEPLRPCCDLLRQQFQQRLVTVGRRGRRIEVTEQARGFGRCEQAQAVQRLLRISQKGVNNLEEVLYDEAPLSLAKKVVAQVEAEKVAPAGLRRHVDLEGDAVRVVSCVYPGYINLGASKLWVLAIVEVENDIVDACLVVADRVATVFQRAKALVARLVHQRGKRLIACKLQPQRDDLHEKSNRVAKFGGAVEEGRANGKTAAAVQAMEVGGEQRHEDVVQGDVERLARELRLLR
jgi:hypothetical protein